MVGDVVHTCALIGQLSDRHRDETVGSHSMQPLLSVVLFVDDLCFTAPPGGVLLLYPCLAVSGLVFVAVAHALFAQFSG